MRSAQGATRLGATDRAVLAALLPGGASDVLSTGLLETGFEEFLAEFERRAPARLSRSFRLGLFAAGWVAPLLVRRLPPLDRLDPDARLRALAAMETSRVPELRLLLRGLKGVASLHYGALPEVRRALGYPR